LTRNRVALLTARVLDEPDPDLEPLARAIEARGARATIVAWDDGPLGRFDQAIFRSTWNYVPLRDAFCAWADDAATKTKLWNPPDVVRWNTDKAYLRELEARGVPIVPTKFVQTLEDISWRDVVIKPRISAASFATRRFDLSRMRSEAEAFLREHRERPMMLQPYIDSVESHGERSLVWIAGELTHAIRKSPRFSQGEERVSEALEIADDEREVAARALEPLASRLLYARVDLVRDSEGRPCVMELELVEPSLFLLQHLPALERFADAIVGALR
jgi:glutathione synthase/RimK-type ligase-like ATP-grasp enzyme